MMKQIMADQKSTAVTNFVSLYSGVARTFSLILALTICLAILGLPQLVVSENGSVDHGWLTILMWGMSAGFVHGVGFVPRNRVLRIVLGPLVAWGVSLLAILAFLKI